MDHQLHRRKKREKRGKKEGNHKFQAEKSKIASTRQTGGSLRAISPYYRPASKGAGFHFVQALLSLPLLLAPPRGYFTL